MTPDEAFQRAFGFVIGAEGGLSMSPADPGNWTGGKINVGELRGTAFGLAASVWYGKLDHWPPTLADAWAIYRPRYWDLVRGDDLPPPLALLVFDAAINSGPDRARRWLQMALRVAVDGVLGKETMAALEASQGRGAEVLVEFSTQRLLFLLSLPTWRTFGLGWTRRILRMELLTTEMAA